MTADFHRPRSDDRSSRTEMDDSADLLAWLQELLVELSNGDWEHGHGITVATLDNPGWSVRVDLEGTALEGTGMDQTERAGEDDWFVCRVRDGVWEGYGGPRNLRDLLVQFRDWYVRSLA